MLMTLVTAKKIADGFVYDVRDIVKKNVTGDDAQTVLAKIKDLTYENLD